MDRIGCGGEVHCPLDTCKEISLWFWAERVIIQYHKRFQNCPQGQAALPHSHEGLGPDPNSLCFCEQSLPLLWASVSLFAE